MKLKLLNSFCCLVFITLNSDAARSKEIRWFQNPWVLNQNIAGLLDNKILQTDDSLKADNEKPDFIENLSEFLDSVHSKKDQFQKSNHSLFEALQVVRKSEVSDDDLKCINDISKWIEDATKLKLYALQMRDSWSMREGGMLEANVRWQGHYWECVNSIGDDFKGKFCTTYYGFNYIPVPSMIPYDITFDSCFPDSCNEEIIQNLTTIATSDDIRVPSLATKCPITDYSYSGIEISTIVISGVILLLALVGTSVDLFIKNERYFEARHNVCGWLLCFSIISNAKKILSTKQSPGNISAINGIRTISTLWVILGHTVAIDAPYMDNVIAMGQDIRRRFEMMVILNGTFSVDTFFCIGGLLTSYLTLKMLKKTKGKMNVPLMYLQRYLRLTPLYAYVLLFSMGIYKFLGSGPIWKTFFDTSNEHCVSYWWTNLVYINNLYPERNYCIGHAWYLACDMQFYLLSPLFIYTMYKVPWLGVGQTIGFSLASIGVTWWLSDWSQQQPVAIVNSRLYSVLGRLIPPSFLDNALSFQEKFKSDIYFAPWCRINVYLIGMLTGYILFKTKHKIKMPKIAVFTGWLVATGTALSIVYGLYGSTSVPEPLDVDVAAFYNAVSRPLWGVCISWVIVACTCGYGGPVTKFLNWKLFLPFSRLTYAAYLIHLYVIYWHTGTQEHYNHYSPIWVAYSFSGHMIISFCLAFVVALLIEWPCQELLKKLLPSRKSSSTHQSNVMQMKENVSSEKPPSYTSDDHGRSDLSETKQQVGRLKEFVIEDEINDLNGKKSGKVNPSYQSHNEFSTNL